MILIKRILTLCLFISLKVFSQHSFNQEESIKIDRLIKRNQWDLVHLRLINENLDFQRISKYPLQYHLLIKLDSATVLYKRGKYPEAKKAVLYSLAQIEVQKSHLSIPHYDGLKHIAVTRLFYIEKRSGNVVQGLKYLNIFSKGMSPIYKKKQLIFYAVAYAELGNYKKSIELLNTHLKDIKYDSKNYLYTNFLKDEESASTYNTIGDAFIRWYKETGNKKLLDSAYLNYKDAYKIMENLSLFSLHSKALFISRQAHLKLLKKEYKNSLILYNQCEKDSILMDKNFSRETVWLGKGEIFTFQKRTDSAFYYIHQLYNNKRSTRCTYENKLKIYHLLSLNYENINDNKNAYKFAKLSLSETEKKSIQDISGNNFLGTYEKSEIKHSSEAIIRANKKNTYLLLIILTILISVAVILFTKNRYSKRKEKIFAEIQKKDKEKNKNLTVIENELVNRILKNLEMLESRKKFLSNNFKLVSIAKQLNTNTAYLSKIINEHKGISFSEYVNDLRINYLLEELQQNQKLRKYTIQTISEEIGYKSSTTFIKAFKDRIKMPPSEYIKNLK